MLANSHNRPIACHTSNPSSKMECSETPKEGPKYFNNTKESPPFQHPFSGSRETINWFQGRTKRSRPCDPGRNCLFCSTESLCGVSQKGRKMRKSEDRIYLTILTRACEIPTYFVRQHPFPKRLEWVYMRNKSASICKVLLKQVIKMDQKAVLHRKYLPKDLDERKRIDPLY